MVYPFIFIDKNGSTKEGNRGPSWVDFKAFPFLFFIALRLIKIELPSVRRQLRIKGKEREGCGESREAGQEAEGGGGRGDGGRENHGEASINQWNMVMPHNFNNLNMYEGKWNNLEGRDLPECGTLNRA